MGTPRFSNPPERPDLEGNYFYDLWRALYKSFEGEAEKRGITVNQFVEWLFAQPIDR